MIVCWCVWLCYVRVCFVCALLCVVLCVLLICLCASCDVLFGVVWFECVCLLCVGVRVFVFKGAGVFCL